LGPLHWVAVSARTAGENDFSVASALGDRSTAMAILYGRDANRQAAQAEALGQLQARFDAESVETGLETARDARARQPKKAGKTLEAWAGIEPAYTDLQSAA
jgi:hypothetical protein